MLNIVQPLHPLFVLLIIVSLGYAFGEICKLVRLPRVVGQIFAGLMLGVPFIKVYMITESTGPMLKFMGDMGILLLFFFVGLQIDVRSFKKNLPEEVLVSVCNTALPFLFGFGVLYFFFGISWMGSLIVGMCLAMGAQAVSIDVLEELGLLKSRVGKIIMSSATIDDVFEIILISIMFALMHISAGDLQTNAVLVDVGIFVVAILALRYVVIPVLLSLFAEERKLTYLFTGAVVITLIMALVTEYLGLGAIIGALFAGLMVREVLMTGKTRNIWEEHNIAKAIHIISFGLFIPIFFVWVGMNTDLTLMFTNTSLLIWMVIIALFGTVIGTVIGVMLHRGTLAEGLIVGWGSAPKGDIELVVAALALGKNIISPDLYSALILMAFFSTLIAPIVFRYVVKRYSGVLKKAA